MVTITQTIQWYVHQQAERIHSLKTAAITRETGERYAYVSADRTQMQDHRPTEQQRAEGWKLEKVSFEKITGHIRPRHADWPMYQAARHQVSLLLTARLLLKVGGGNVPELSEVRAAIREGQVSHHAKRGRTPTLVYKAYRYLRKLMNRLERAPERFQMVEQWQQNLSATTIRNDKEGVHA